MRAVGRRVWRVCRARLCMAVSADRRKRVWWFVWMIVVFGGGKGSLAGERRRNGAVERVGTVTSCCGSAVGVV